jgi:hypothetical protein
MTSAPLIQQFLVLVNLKLINGHALFERLGVQGSAPLPIDFDDMYGEIMLMDDETLVAALPAQGMEDKNVGSAAPSNAGAEDDEQEDDPRRWTGMNEANGA